MTPRATGGFRERHRAVLTVAICAAAAMFEGLDIQAAGVAGPRLVPLFHLSPGQAGLAFAASMAGLLAGAPVSGLISDRLGRKPVLVASIALFGAFALATALANDFASLTALRFATGLGLGGAMPNLIAVCAENSPAGRKGLGVGLMYAGMPVGGALASLTALAPGADWRAVFVVGGLAPLLLAPAVALGVLEPVRAETGPGAGPLSHTLFGDGRWLRTLLLWTGFGSTLVVVYVVLNWMPSLLVGRGFSRSTALWTQVAFNTVGVGGCALMGWRSEGRLRTWIAATAFAASVALMAAFSVMPPIPPAAVVAGAALGASMMAEQTLLYALAPGIYPAAVRGAGVGAAVAVGRVGSLAGPLIGGVVLSAGGTPAQVLVLMAPILLVGAAASLALSALR